MKFICKKSSLLKEIGIAQDILPSGASNALTILSNVYLAARDGLLTIKATDINTYYETKVPVTVIEEGVTTVFGGKLFTFVSSFPDGDIEFEQTEQKFTIKAAEKKLRFSLRTMSEEQYPEFQSFEKLDFFSIPIREFKDMIGQTLFAVSYDPTRPHMNGVFFEKANSKLIMVATDGRRLALIEKDSSGALEFPSAIIPTKILFMIAKYAGDEGQIALSITGKNFFVEFGSYKFYSNLFEGQFPNYRKVIPEEQKYAFSVERDSLLQAMKRVHPLVENQSERLYFNISKNSLAVYVKDSEIGSGEEEIEAKYDGEEFQFALKYSNLEEPLRALTTDTVKIRFTDLNRAFTVEPEPEGDYFHIMMPMQTEV
jgi:DNA polymerase-3 subunit beta